MNRGTKIHQEFDNLLQDGAAGRNVSGETSYLNGMHDGRYRPKGSSSPDAVLGSVQNPTAVFDLKTGKSGISSSQMNKYQRNLPDDTSVYKVTSSGHDVPRPTTYTGIGLGGNAIYNLAK